MFFLLYVSVQHAHSAEPENLLPVEDANTLPALAAAPSQRKSCFRSVFDNFLDDRNCDTLVEDSDASCRVALEMTNCYLDIFSISSYRCPKEMRCEQCLRQGTKTSVFYSLFGDTNDEQTARHMYLQFQADILKTCQFAEQQHRSERLTKKVLQVTEQIGNVASMTLEVNTKVGEVDSKVTEVASQMEVVSSWAETISSQVGEASSQLDGISTEVESVSSQMGDVASQLSHVSTHVEDVSWQMGSLSWQMTTLQDEQREATAIAKKIRTEMQSDHEELQAASQSSLVAISAVGEEVNELRERAHRSHEQLQAGMAVLTTSTENLTSGAVQAADKLEAIQDGLGSMYKLVEMQHKTLGVWGTVVDIGWYVGGVVAALLLAPFPSARAAQRYVLGILLGSYFMERIMAMVLDSDFARNQIADRCAAIDPTAQTTIALNAWCTMITQEELKWIVRQGAMALSTAALIWKMLITRDPDECHHQVLHEMTDRMLVELPQKIEHLVQQLQEVQQLQTNNAQRQQVQTLASPSLWQFHTQDARSSLPRPSRSYLGAVGSPDWQRHGGHVRHHSAHASAPAPISVRQETADARAPRASTACHGVLAEHIPTTAMPLPTQQETPSDEAMLDAAVNEKFATLTAADGLTESPHPPQTGVASSRGGRAGKRKSITNSRNSEHTKASTPTKKRMKRDMKE
ncbi:hypothetical protein CYMTET_48330 [Cymbomonas tetramitiformis]|uniref:t-SNARE coiled-coil homology domain-containing protein n=1 Tax=Cymbomonas tetramitiformis TaxID=36881 RepID=A0AAE0BUC7_9CHLO|nr:hypothetical protein CYMTET_48330 [Cymbomonas tetramitiformis]